MIAAVGRICKPLFPASFRRKNGKKAEDLWPDLVGPRLSGDAGFQAPLHRLEKLAVCGRGILDLQLYPGLAVPFVCPQATGSVDFPTPGGQQPLPQGRSRGPERNGVKAGAVTADQP